MNYIVFDLEWNQAADGKTKPENDMVFEIIEIGAIKLDSRKNYVDCFQELIKPQVFHEMNQITGELIHLSMDELEHCRCFPEVADDFLQWCGEDFVFCTWADTDLFELQRNMHFYHMPPLSDKPIRFYDVQKLFSIAFEDRKTRRTLEYAVDFLQLEKKDAFHRADADAYYTAMVFASIERAEVFGNFSYDTYHLPKDRADEIHVIFDDYGKYISRAFPNKITAMRDSEVLSCKCYLCGNRTKKKIPWFTSNGKHYYTIVRCSTHGMIKQKIRLRKSVDNQTYVIKTMKQVGEAVVEDIRSKWKRTRL